MTETVLAVVLAETPLIDRGVHQLGLGGAFAFALEQLLLERAHQKLIGLLLEPQSNRLSRVDLLEQGRLRVEGVRGIGDIVLDVLDRLQRGRPVSPRAPRLINRKAGDTIEEL